MKKRKSLALILVFVFIISAFSACGKAASEPYASSAAEANTSDTASVAETPADPLPADSVEDTVSTEGNLPISMPLSEEPVSFSLWIKGQPLGGTNMNDYNDGKFYPYMEQLTNVHIDFTASSATEEAENFNIMLASGTYTDAFAAENTSSFYTGGLDKAIEEEIIIPLEDYGTYYKNYNHWRSVDTTTLYSSVTPEGHIGGIFMLKVPQQDSFQGPVIRMDLLEQYGYEGSASDIVTLDDFAEVLELFHNNGIKTPWWGSGNFMLGLDAFIMPAFDIYNEGLLYQLDGNVMFGPAQDSFKDYLALYRDWYTNGYIGADFMSQNPGINDDLIGGMMGGDVGIGVTPNALFDMINSGTADNGKWTGISIPIAYEGQELVASYDGTWGPSRKAYTNTVLSISTSCNKDLIPIILQYFDYLYTDEGSMLATYGIEGESYTLDENGEPQFADFIKNSEEGYSFSQQFVRYCCFHNVPFRYDWRRDNAGISEEAVGLMDIWETHLARDLDEFVNLSVPTELSSTYASKYNELSTYAEEYALKVITGSEDLDTSWDQFQQQLIELGLEDVLTIQQDALDTFYSADVSIGMITE